MCMRIIWGGGFEQFSDLWLSECEVRDAVQLFPSLPYDPEQNKLGNVQLHTIKGIERIELGGRNLQLIPTPGHTWGSICAYDSKTGIILTGDTLSRRVFLFTAKPAVPFRIYRESLEKLLEYHPARILPGHDSQPMDPIWINKMIGMLDSFSPEKGKIYDRPEFGDSLMLYTVGRGIRRSGVLWIWI